MVEGEDVSQDAKDPTEKTRWCGQRKPLYKKVRNTRVSDREEEEMLSQSKSKLMSPFQPLRFVT